MQTLTTRVPRNHNGKPRDLQMRKRQESTDAVRVKSKFDAEFDLPHDAAHASCMAVFCRSSQKPVSKVPLREEEYGSLYSAALNSGEGVGEFVAQAVRERLARVQSSSQRRAIQGDNELERSVGGMARLVTRHKTYSTLISDKILDLAKRNGTDSFEAEFLRRLSEVIIEDAADLEEAWTHTLSALCQRAERIVKTWEAAKH